MSGLCCLQHTASTVKKEKNEHGDGTWAGLEVVPLTSPAFQYPEPVILASLKQQEDEDAV